jgi:F-type H+-transporting ATPase subunit g
MRPTLRATRLAGRRMNSSSAPQVNPQVQKAVEAASKAYNTGAAHVKRVAGPVGEKLGGALGGRSLYIQAAVDMVSSNPGNHCSTRD